MLRKLMLLKFRNLLATVVTGLCLGTLVGSPLVHAAPK